MKKSLILLILLLACSLVYAAGPQGVHESGVAVTNGSVNQSSQGSGQGHHIQQETQNAGEQQNLSVQQQVAAGNGEGLQQNLSQGTGQELQLQPNASKGEGGLQQGSGAGEAQGQGVGLRAANMTQLRQTIQSRKQLMNQELEEKDEKQRIVYRNQNQIRLAVHSLLAMENFTGGIGPQVSQIAKEFNNSVQATIRAEERIREREGLTRFLFGGDDEAAGEIDQEVNRSRQRIQQLKQLQQQSNMSEGVNAMMQEQIQAMEQEQERLQQMVQQEKQSKGLLGWLWK